MFVNQTEPAVVGTIGKFRAFCAEICPRWVHEGFCRQRDLGGGWYQSFWQSVWRWRGVVSDRQEFFVREKATGRKGVSGARDRFTAKASLKKNTETPAANVTYFEHVLIDAHFSFSPVPIWDTFCFCQGWLDVCPAGTEGLQDVPMQCPFCRILLAVYLV